MGLRSAISCIVACGCGWFICRHWRRCLATGWRQTARSVARGNVENSTVNIICGLPHEKVVGLVECAAHRGTALLA